MPVQNLTPGWNVTSLGNPAASFYQACWQTLPRTPWDLALFDGRLYVGLGNSSNQGPSANAGPVPLFAYDLKERRWRQEATLPEEQISRFLVDGQQLWIAGEDPRGSWRWGNLYRNKAFGQLWWQQRNLPGFVHAHDLAVYQGRLVVAGNVQDAVDDGAQIDRYGSALGISDDAGQTWSVHRSVGWRSTSLLPFSEALFAIEALPGPQLKHWLQKKKRWEAWTAVHQWHAEKGWQPRPEITLEHLFPGVQGIEERSGWIDTTTPNHKGVAWISTLGPRGVEASQRRAFVGQIDAGLGLLVHPISLSLDEQAMDWQADQDDWLLLSSQQLISGIWRSRIQRYTLIDNKPKTLGTEILFDAPLPAWSLAGDQNKIFIALGKIPLTRESIKRSCSDEGLLSGSIWMAIKN